jgi:hypothetical protein
MKALNLVKTATFAALLAAMPVFAVKYVAVVETDIDARSGAAAEITPAEVTLITAELRREAVKNLPHRVYNIMTTETVMAQGSATLIECHEENCVIALGSKIGADYIVRGTISKFQTLFTLTVDIYETEDGNLVASSDPVRSENIRGLLENAAPACANMYRNFVATQDTGVPPLPAPTPAPPPAPKPAKNYQTYTLTTSASPPDGGHITRNPDKEIYAAGEKVGVTAVAADGYVFKGWRGTTGNWTGAVGGGKNSLTVTMDAHKALTANFYRETIPAAQPPKPAAAALSDAPKKKSSFWAGLALDAAGAGLLMYGIIKESNVKDYVNDGYYANRAEHEDAKKAASSRNAGYAIGSALLLTGISFHVFF